MIPVDKFLDRVPGPGYKCFDFAREVWRESFGIDVGDALQGLSAAIGDRRVLASEVKGFAKLTIPIDPCFVIFQRKRSTPHIGVWHKNRVLHLQGGQSAQYVRIDEIGRRYTKVSYWK